MSEIDKSQYERIEAAIRATELAMAGNPHIRKDAAMAMLEPSKKRLEALEQQGLAPHQSDEERRKQENTSVAIAMLVMQETQLSSLEKQTYGGFLQQEFFTRSDFGKLDEFYADGGAWDRLSGEGKKQMSERLWKGIERGEYSFDEIPENVRKKEADQLNLYLQNPESAPAFVSRIDPETVEKFQREYASGNQEAALAVLDSKELFESLPAEETQAAMEHSGIAASRSHDGITEVEATSDKAEVENTEVAGIASFDTLAPADPTTLRASSESLGRS